VKSSALAWLARRRSPDAWPGGEALDLLDFLLRPQPDLAQARRWCDGAVLDKLPGSLVPLLVAVPGRVALLEGEAPDLARVLPVVRQRVVADAVAREGLLRAGAALQSAGVRAVVLRGAALLAAPSPPRPRITRGVELLVDGAPAAQAFAVLRDAGFEVRPTDPGRGPRRLLALGEESLAVTEVPTPLSGRAEGPALLDAAAQLGHQDSVLLRLPTEAGLAMTVAHGAAGLGFPPLGWIVEACERPVPGNAGLAGGWTARLGAAAPLAALALLASQRGWSAGRWLLKAEAEAAPKWSEIRWLATGRRGS
jgi:hypothetical protein